MNSGFWKTDWFLGLVVVIAMLALGRSDLLQSLERKAYDIGVAASTRAPSVPPRGSSASSRRSSRAAASSS